MDKQYLTDANGIEWTLEEVKDEKYGDYFWFHVTGDDEQFSGFVGNTLGGTFEQFVDGGYLYKEEK